jgi:rhodanese-related sulfurtransferase
MIEPSRRARTPRHFAVLRPALVLALVLAAPGGCAPAPPVSGAPPGAAATPANVQHLSADQVDTWRGMHYDGLVLDVRTVGEWDDDLGHMVDALPIPAGELESRLGEIERYQGKAVLLYDRTGASNTRVGQILVTHGFRDVTALDGGLKAYRDWQQRP